MNSERKMNTAVKILPFVFALHNAEEAWTINRYPNQAIPLHDNVAPAQFIVAVLLFTILGFVLVFGKKIYPSNKSYQYAVTGFSGMLFLNSFFPHILSAIILRSYTPGLISATVLLLPLTSYILRQIYKSQSFSKKQLIATILSGGAIGLVLVFLFLWIGFIFTH